MISEAKNQKKDLDNLADEETSMTSSILLLEAKEKSLEEELSRVRSQIQAAKEQVSTWPSRIELQKKKVALAVAAVKRQIPLATPVPGDNATDQAILNSAQDLMKKAASTLSAFIHDCN